MRSRERSRWDMRCRRCLQAYSSLVVGFTVDECGGAWMDVEMVGARCCGGSSLHRGPAVAAAAAVAAVRHERRQPRRHRGAHWPPPVPPPGSAVWPCVQAPSPLTCVDDAGTAPSPGSALSLRSSLPLRQPAVLSRYPCHIGRPVAVAPLLLPPLRITDRGHRLLLPHR